jgi:hypothetical protein
MSMAETPNKSESDFLGEIPVVLTASRILQSPLDVPAPVTVIDRDATLPPNRPTHSGQGAWLRSLPARLRERFSLIIAP